MLVTYPHPSTQATPLDVEGHHLPFQWVYPLILLKSKGIGARIRIYVTWLCHYRMHRLKLTQVVSKYITSTSPNETT